MNKKRNIQLELIRILAIFMIILGHAATHGHAGENFENNVIRYLLIAIETFSVPGTDIFVIISGYVLFRAKVSFKRIITVWLQILFYSLSLYLIITIVGLNEFEFIDLIKAIFPVTFNQYWFMRVYFYLLLCAPFLNILLENLGQKAHQVMLVLGIILMVIPASIPGIARFNSDAGNGILWFVMLYSTGSYFSKYMPKFSAKRYTVIAFCLFLLAFTSRISIAYISKKLGFEGMGMSRFSTFDAFPIYGEACCIVCAGIKLKSEISNHPKVEKLILFFSGSTAGVYMLHEHPLIRKILWSGLGLQNSSVLYSIFISIIILVVCVIIDNLTWKKCAQYLKKLNFAKVNDFFEQFFEIKEYDK